MNIEDRVRELWDQCRDRMTEDEFILALEGDGLLTADEREQWNHWLCRREARRWIERYHNTIDPKTGLPRVIPCPERGPGWVKRVENCTPEEIQAWRDREAQKAQAERGDALLQ